MRNLLNLIFENIIPIIIVVSVITRVLAGMKKSSASRRRAVPPVPDIRQEREDEDEEADVWSRLRPDPDDGEDEEAAGLPVRPPVPAIRPLLMPAPSFGGPPLPSPPPANPDPVIARPFAPVTLMTELEGPKPDAKARPPQAASGPGPLDRLNSHPPLRRAVILAEILGAPKGLN
jgi:hypothetical protein